LSPKIQIDRFGSGQVDLSANQFNRYRNEIKTLGPLQFENWKIKDKDLAAHNLSKSRFFKCDFEDIRFGDLIGIDFSECSFTNCDFRNRQTSRTMITGILFFESVISNFEFHDIDLSDVKIVDCNFVSKKSNFTGCRLLTNLIIEHRGSHSDFLSLSNIDFDTRTGANLVYVCPTPIPRPNWESIRFLSRIPLLQISFFTVALLIALVQIVDLFNTTSVSATDTCRYFMEHQAKIGNYVDCTKYANQDFVRSVLRGYAELAIVTTALLVSSLCHTVYCPGELLDYSKSQWTRDLRRSEIQYELISLDRRALSIFVLLTYILILIYSFWKFGGKCFEILKVLFSGA
jgi:hypothetical protein